MLRIRHKARENLKRQEQWHSINETIQQIYRKKSNLT